MKKCIVLGIDAPLSPATRQAIRAIKEFVGPMMPQLRLILLHVIPLPYIASSTMSVYTGQLQQNVMTMEQRQEAEKTLAAVRSTLQEQELTSLRVDICIRMGSPAEEIVKVARETHADLVIVGSRGNTPLERVRRLLMGSKSRRVLQGATCPVMIVTALPTRRPTDLVTWYETEITRYLRENPGGLTIFTPAEVAQLFAPPTGKKEPGRKERAAAAQALEHLAGAGVLCRHEVAGQLRYVND
jgi:nucleotide-binding universal stress UspA family protein